MKKLTKIIATLGPSTDTKEKIQELYKAGMNVVRLNFSHGNYEYFSELIDKIREVDEKICIMLDTRGPELRTNPFTSEGLSLEKGDIINLEYSKKDSDEKTIRINYSGLTKVKDGTDVFFDDGLISARIIKNNNKISAKLLNGGFLGNKKGVTFRGHNVDIPSLTEKDKQDILFGIKKDIDYVAASYIRTSEEVRELNDFVKNNNSEMKIISKIEHYSSIHNISEIIEASDGIMIARGDLGVELDLETIPLLQRSIIRKCNFLGRPVIVATQMLESMTKSPRPTRAEVSDIAHAILQGADAIMLSGETAQGNYPIESVETMNRIALVYDSRVKNVFDESLSDLDEAFTNEVSLFVTKAAYLASKSIKTAAILTPTETGYTAQKVSRFKPKCPILAITRSMKVLRQLQLSWGVFPTYDPEVYTDFEKYTNNLVIMGMKEGFLKSEDMFVITAGHKLHQSGTTNLIEIYKVSDIIERMQSPEKEKIV
ncbi:MAG: pyruvate kinase [Nanobdellota archaeon]